MTKRKIQESIEISLTDFINFVNKTGNNKLTVVKQVKHRVDYDPFTDFYKPIREKIQQIHKKGGVKSDLDSIINTLKDEKKKINYPTIITGYKKFWGRKNIKWFKPPYKKWFVGDISIRLNPELGLEYDNRFYVIKLYFKEESIKRAYVNQILTLMEYQLRKKLNEPEVIFALLDIRKGKMYTKEGNKLDELPLLLGEAKSFEEIWKNIE